MGISGLVGVKGWARVHHVRGAPSSGEEDGVGTSRTEEGVQVPVWSSGLGHGGCP